MEEHMDTPHTPGKRYKTSDGCIYMNWKLPNYCVTTPRTDTDINAPKGVDRTLVGAGCRVGAELNANPDGPSDDSDPRIKATVPVKPAPCSVRHTYPRMADSQDHVISQHTP